MNYHEIKDTERQLFKPATGLLLPRWINFSNNRNHYKMWDEITYPFPKIQWWSGMDKPTLYWVCNYLSILGW